MLLTIDVGNTNSVLGVFRGEELIANWRLTTAREQTIDEYGVLTRNLFTLAGLDRDAITGVIISSVVPPVNRTLAEMSRVYFGKKALFVELGVKTEFHKQRLLPKIDSRHFCKRPVHRRNHRTDDHARDGVSIQPRQSKQIPCQHAIFVDRLLACRRQTPIRD